MTAYQFNPTWNPAQARRELDTFLYRLEGQRIAGTYYDVPFTGTVTRTRQHTCTGRPEITVTLDSPITVYGAEHEAVIIDSRAIETETSTIFC